MQWSDTWAFLFSSHFSPPLKQLSAVAAEVVAGAMGMHGVLTNRSLFSSQRSCWNLMVFSPSVSILLGPKYRCQHRRYKAEKNKQGANFLNKRMKGGVLGTKVLGRALGRRKMTLNLAVSFWACCSPSLIAPHRLSYHSFRIDLYLESKTTNPMGLIWKSSVVSSPETTEDSRCGTVFF